MKAWIANLLSMERGKRLPVVKTFRRDGLRADVFEHRRRCGDVGRLVELSRWFEREDEWLPVGFLYDDDLQRVIELLQEAKAFVEDRRYKLIASFVHGNALGVVLEPQDELITFVDVKPEERWKICIGPLMHAATDGEFPEEDYRKVVADLKQFCKEKGLEDWVTIPKR